MAHYDYICPDCGSFDDWRAMRDAAKPSPCPACGRLSPRAIAAPNISTLSSGARIAHGRNEKSADEPRLVTRSGPQPGGCHGGEHGHAHKSGRPWMIGH